MVKAFQLAINISENLVIRFSWFPFKTGRQDIISSVWGHKVVKQVVDEKKPQFHSHCLHSIRWQTKSMQVEDKEFHHWMVKGKK